MTVTWNATFEATPADTDEAKYGANKIRELKTAIQERMDIEHTFSNAATGAHILGRCGILYYGTTAAIAALSSPPAGSLAFDTTLNVIKYANGTAWVTPTLDHGALDGLTDDDHTRYISANKVGQTLEQNLDVTANITIDGRDLSVDGAKLDATKGIVMSANATDIKSYTTDCNWTDVDISANVGATANYAIIMASVILIANTADVVVTSALFRPKGSNVTAVANLMRVIAKTGTGSTVSIAGGASAMIFVELDANKVYQIKVTSSGGTPSSLTVSTAVMGYLY